MSWHPNDLLTDTDLVAYESTILTQFARLDWQDRRQRVLEDWLWPILRGRGLDPDKFRTRYQPDAAYGHTSSVYTDVLGALTSTTTDDLDLGTTLAAPTDALYIGGARQFKGLSVRVLDSVSAVPATLTVQAWVDRWVTLSVVDGTQATSGVPFSAGGAITWTVPETWVPRAINASARVYWVRLLLSAAPTSAMVTQIGCIRRSLLGAPVTLRTLAYIFREAPTRQDGPWLQKAEWYEAQADFALERAIPLIGGEFDTTDDDLIDTTEGAQTLEEAADVEATFGFERR